MSHQQQLKQFGYTVLRDIIPQSTIVKLREAVKQSIVKRPAPFLDIANPADVLNQEVKQEDPRMTALKRKFAAHREKRKMMLKQRRKLKQQKSGNNNNSQNQAQEQDEESKFINKPISDATAADIARLSQRITQQLAALDPSDTRIQNDPQRLKAIDEHRCNLWMTSPETLSKYLHSDGDFGKEILGKKCCIELFGSSSFSNPTLFCDRPIVQLPYGRPTLMHFAAPFFGLEQVRGILSDEEVLTTKNNNNGNNNINALSVWIPLEEPIAPTEENFALLRQKEQEEKDHSSNLQKMTRRRARLLQEEKNKNKSSSSDSRLSLLSTPIRVLEGSHRIVRQRMLQDPRKYDIRLFRSDFNAVDSAIALWMRRFPEFSPVQNDSTSTTVVRATELENIRPGTAVVFDPYTFAGLGPNVSTHSQCVMQFLIMNNTSSPETATIKPSIHPYSWIRDWKSSSLSVDFSNNVVFPKLF